MADQHEPTHIPQNLDETLDWIRSNKLRAVGYTWLSGVGLTMAYQWSRPISTSLKLIHTRVYAQAITLGSLAAIAGLEMYNQSQKEQEKK